MNTATCDVGHYERFGTHIFLIFRTHCVSDRHIHTRTFVGARPLFRQPAGRGFFFVSTPCARTALSPRDTLTLRGYARDVPAAQASADGGGAFANVYRGYPVVYPASSEYRPVITGSGNVTCRREFHKPEIGTRRAGLRISGTLEQCTHHHACTRISRIKRIFVCAKHSSKNT